MTKKEREAEKLRLSDPLGAERDDVAWGTHEELPSGGSVAVVGAAIPVAKSSGSRPHSLHSGTRPIPGCPVCTEMEKERK